MHLGTGLNFANGKPSALHIYLSLSQATGNRVFFKSLQNFERVGLNEEGKSYGFSVLTQKT